MSITVCIPVFNRRELIGAAVRSALDQAIDDLEVLVVDNHSSDGTWEYLQTIRDPRLRLVRNDSNLGMFGNFNRCGELAKGEYILFLCSDDRLKPDFLPHALLQLKANPNAALLSSQGIMVDETGRPLGLAGKFLAPGSYDSESITKAYFWAVANYGINIFNYPSGIVLRGDAARQALPFRDEFGGPADIDYFFRALRYGDLLIDPAAGCEITIHRSQTANKNKQSGTMLIELVNLARFYLDTPANQRFWREIHGQLSASALPWAFRKIKAGHLLEAVNGRKFGFHWHTILLASFRRVGFMLLYRMGRYPVKYANFLQATSASNVYSYSDTS